MKIDIHLEIEDSNLGCYELLKDVVEVLEEENNVSRKAILSSILLLASNMIEEEKVILFKPSALFSDDDEEDDDEYERYREDNKKIDSFKKSEISIKTQELHEKSERLYQLKKFDEWIETLSDFFETLPTLLAKLEVELKDIEWRYHEVPYFEHSATQAASYYAIFGDEAGLNHLLEKTREIGDITTLEYFDFEVFEVEFEKYRDQLHAMHKITDYLAANPKSLQRDVLKTLSLDGRKYSGLLAAADKYGRLLRSKSGTSWLLSVN